MYEPAAERTENPWLVHFPPQPTTAAFLAMRDKIVTNTFRFKGSAIDKWNTPMLTPPC